MLELRRVSKSFSGIAAVDHVSFVARPGEVTGCLGPACLPSYWFLGLFDQLNGSPALSGLARRGWIALGVAAAGAAIAYALSYFRTIRRIVEEPDIVAAARGFVPLRFGSALTNAIVGFSCRTLLRSRQHRVMLAFYAGIGFAIVIFF